jgi:hypothetical protein
VKNRQKAMAMTKRGREPTREALCRMSGVDLTAIDTIRVRNDLSRFPSEKEFVSHITPGRADR